MMEVTVAAEVGEGILRSREEGVDQQVEDVEEEAEEAERQRVFCHAEAFESVEASQRPLRQPEPLWREA